MAETRIDLYWLPVGAGTSRAQQASLRFWEWFEALRARRPRAVLYHSALKLMPAESEKYTLELAPEFIGSSVPPLLTGPVGLRWAGRFRLFRYQLLALPVDALPDEQWAVDSPVHLSGEAEMARQVLDLAPQIPGYTWGRRVRGTREMWTSDSAISWLLTTAGIDLSAVAPPAGGRAPGWDVGIALARRTRSQ